MKKTIKLSFRTSERANELLEAVAEMKGISKSSLINICCIYYCKKYLKKYKK